MRNMVRNSGVGEVGDGLLCDFAVPFLARRDGPKRDVNFFIFLLNSACPKNRIVWPSHFRTVFKLNLHILGAVEVARCLKLCGLWPPEKQLKRPFLSEACLKWFSGPELGPLGQVLV